MGDDLHRLSKVISTALLGDDMVVDLAGSDIVVTAKSNAEIAFIVSKIQICFCTIIANEHFTVSFYCVNECRYTGGSSGTNSRGYIKIY